MDASRVASEFLKFRLGGNDCGLISGLFVQIGPKPVAGLDGHARGRCSSPLWASREACPDNHSALPDPRSDRFTITSSTRLTHSLRHPLLWVVLSRVDDLSRLRSRAAATWRSALPLR